MINFSLIKKYTLHKGERLKKRSAIEYLFQKGKTFGLYPFRIYFALIEKQPAQGDEENGLKAGFAVSKRYFKKAVDRNRIKRLTREGYRLQKNTLQQAVEKSKLAMHLFFIYTGKELPDFNLIKEKTGAAIRKLEAEILKQQQ